MSFGVNRHTALALGQLRGAVTICCWIVGVALVIHVITWSLTTFTDLRHDNVAQQHQGAAEVVSTRDQDEPELYEHGEAPREAVAVNRVLTKYDRYFEIQTQLSTGVGILAIVALLPMLGLGVILAAGSATPGVERAVSSFVALAVLTALIVPFGKVVDVMPFQGVFASYSDMIADVTANETGRIGGLAFYGAYLILPLACMVGITVVALRFRSGVEAGLFPREDLRLDPALEREASNIAATSLVGGGRAAGGLQGIIAAKKAPKKVPEEAPAQSLRKVSPGKPQKRPI